ncbi:MAG: MBOAT family protein, partial [Bacilli bacterium]|nr:MBOAT family protein [Bacilli bacterium]
LFYYLGEKGYIILLLLSCIVNYCFGLLIAKFKNKTSLILGLIFNIGLLFYFKYTNFFFNTFANIFSFKTPTLNIILPLGISFFTFQNVSYLIDVYRKDISPEKNIFNYATYITLFPQLVAGPIVRYSDIMKELASRKESIKLFSEGIERFIIGLAKKVIIADTIYGMYTNILSYNLSMLSYILVAIGFTFQIYYDFSGYSDMAIGLGKMFGFNFKENFNYPLISSSITEFWRRWHMSLSGFFKDYVYIPLGGNRCSILKNICNIFTVWILTGLWHGASWNFIIWGLYFFVFLIFEKFVLKKYLKKGLLSHLYTFLIIIISFVIFSVTDLSEILVFLKGMFGIGVPLYNKEILYYLKNNIILLIIDSLGISQFLKNKINTLKKCKLEIAIE